MQDLCCSAKAFRSSTSPGSRTPGEPPAARHSMPLSVLPAAIMRASASPSVNNFGAQSLRFRSGSVAPCPTLKPHVTASAPRTRYGRSAIPYPAGLCSRYTSTAYKGLRLPPLASGKRNQISFRFHSTHHKKSFTPSIQAHFVYFCWHVIKSCSCIVNDMLRDCERDYAFFNQHSCRSGFPAIR